MVITRFVKTMEVRQLKQRGGQVLQRSRDQEAGALDWVVLQDWDGEGGRRCKDLQRGAVV